ncbi:GNAT family N-acetyltransferase [Caulobacter sp. 73W]|uniref:GNAT family N-acetyltransferase n=1 Tax=Caulobacter sp. 73W TaxID=3161137 RepID=A0AB39KQK0_9CAUL
MSRFTGTIRDLTNADRESWDGLWAGYLAFYESSDLPQAVGDTTFERMLDPAEPMFALVAEQDGQAIGFAHCVVHRATWTTGFYCYLEDLFVSPVTRGSGAGRALIEAIYARADAEGWDRVYWLTHETNTQARKLYDAVAQNRGFIQYRR